MKYPLVRAVGLNICRFGTWAFSPGSTCGVAGDEPRQVQRIEAGDTDPGLMNIMGMGGALVVPWGELFHGVPLSLAEWKRMARRAPRQC